LDATHPARVEASTVDAATRPSPPVAAEPRGQPQRRAPARGIAAGVASYVAWGALPIYFKALHAVAPLEILAHRVVWSMAFLAVVVTARREWRGFAAAFGGRRLVPYLASTALISTNWLTYIWAVNAGRLLEASLGYFVNPLVSVLLGVLFMGERLGKRQRVAVALAGAGVLVLVVRLGTLPWVSLVLALSFGLYGLVRKRAPIDAIVGLLVETALLAPLALGYLAWLAREGRSSFGATPSLTVLLALLGVITALPLIWFAMGVRSLRLSTMGVLQYLAPTGQFLLAVALYREPFTRAHAVAFALIWTSLALYTWNAVSPPKARGAAAEVA
jgi:chloramphenicol-sensitive protein RarD